ncbi:glycoside hydrolase family 2 protein, partial [Paraburkholderia aspalathi]|nr:glycoside hydrolase family 2 protein [Paraburkholderia aspalathi]
ICFRAIKPHLDKKGPPARWRTQLMNHQGLRLIRTTALGHMPGWCPEIHAIGPWRPIWLIRPDNQAPTKISITSAMTDNGAGILDVSLAHSNDKLSLLCAGEETSFTRGDDGLLHARLTLPDVAPWWPHTHGTPTLHDISVRNGLNLQSIGRTGFRHIAVDRGDDGRGFALVINSRKIFCRGANWSSADIVGLPGDRQAYAPWLKRAPEADMNMIRIPGITTYESPAFFDLCDELGILVWQDFMFANFDYPVKDDAFVASITLEAQQFLENTRAAPSLAVLCGGSEIYQQAAMMGLPEPIWNGPLTEDILKNIATRLRPDVPYVANSPCGGALPFVANQGISHYYGVSAYGRPLDDARRAQVRFTTECLAFSNVPEPRTLKAHLDVPAVHDPRWKARLPRDRGVSWDFEDVRDTYLEMLYDFEPSRLRREDPEHYLHLSRAVTAEVMEAVFAEWRRPDSSCFGGLVWMLQDLMPGAGWGVIDATGEPKSSWYGLKRAFRPLQIALTDEGVNGLAIHLLNEHPLAVVISVEITCLRSGCQPVVSGRRELNLATDDRQTIAATDLFGAFFDTTYAYRFGPASHDVTVARLRDGHSGAILAEAFHFPQGRKAAFHDTTITATLTSEDDAWFLDLSAPVLAQSVHIDLENHRADDNWFHLAPDVSKRLKLAPRSGIAADVKPTGEIRIAGSSRIVWF